MYVYFVRNTDGTIKIGTTTRPDVRMQQHDCRRYGRGGQVVGDRVLIGICYGNREAERQIHKHLAEHKVELEPFEHERVARETFALPQHVVDTIVQAFGKPRENDLRLMMVKYGPDDEARLWGHLRRACGSNEIGEFAEPIA
jgi:hypothetical protein